jgi:DNA-binding transcriptional LysR family regulator
MGTLVARKLFETRIITVASPRYVAEHGQPGKPEEVSKHQRIMFYNPVTAKPFEWEFHRGKKVTEIPAEGRLLVSDVETMLGACIAGAGIAQVMEIGVEQLMHDGLLMDLFPDWSDERFPRYALFPSRRHRAAKIEAFINFCLESSSSAAPVAHRRTKLRGNVGSAKA